MISQRIVVLPLIVAVLAVAVHGSPYKLCKTPSIGTVVKVVIEGCSDDVQSCVLRKGTEAKLSLTFIPNVDVKSLVAKAYGLIAGVPVPYPLKNSDACKDSGLSCPLKKDPKVTYKQAFDVMKEFPSMSLTVKWVLRDEQNADIVCVLIPVKLV